MEKRLRRIGVLTSGGDAPGMNAAIRAVVRTCLRHDITPVGVYRGYNGLIHSDVDELGSTSVSGIANKGGTMLYTARCEEFKTPEGLPATIDNDIGCSHYSIGFDTAANTAIGAIDKLTDTMQSHERTSIVEVMGNNAGHLAVYVGLAVGATAVLIPEKQYDFERDVAEPIREGRYHDKRHHIIIVAEGVGHTNEIAERIHAEMGLETRVTIIGHIQRGGSPSARDRAMAARMGHCAVEQLIAGGTNLVVCYRDSRICVLPIETALEMRKELDAYMYRVAEEISI